MYSCVQQVPAVFEVLRHNEVIQNLPKKNELEFFNFNFIII